METKYCQSCAMPLSDPSMYGTEADGKPSADYCSYCYADGAFAADMTMQQMIDFCVPHMVGEQYTEQQARLMMEESFPTLKRWAQTT